ncbi:hypothetical protein BH11PSE2_BH11PSE2_02560 [soil metagenome]
MTANPDNSALVAAHRRRLFIMLGAVGVCFMVAVAAVISYAGDHAAWKLGVFATAILGGFGAQAWMIVRFFQTGKPRPPQ